MPHPERFVRRTQHPHWSRLGQDLDPDGIKIFRNAVRYVRETFVESFAAQPSGERCRFQRRNAGTLIAPPAS